MNYFSFILVIALSFNSFANTTNSKLSTKIENSIGEDNYKGKRQRNSGSSASKRSLARQSKHAKKSIKRNDKRNKKMLKHRSKKQKRQSRFSKKDTFR